ncbi:Thiamine biosynthesis lipoprotein ApbE precursor [Rubripirellula tenax]|uniref:FAD:protein FMN transferase n=1 Tax=Rubripirellula tenax TaxID=2528015 RepID=A0A5C6EJ64_9BACT|nr:DUF2271 domain-containing protein [Rubripirellula tenax]TWU48520.1 Thiamine biosynthesis lipoprotein ApbE precursor [Rubripirellula tenax]
MKSSFPSTLFLVFIAYFAPFSATPSVSEEFEFHHENVLGSSLELRLTTDTIENAKAAQSVALNELDRLAEVFSSYSSTSEFAKFCSLEIDEAMLVSPELLRTLQACDQWGVVSGGAFSPAMESLSRIWNDAQQTGKSPTPETLASKVRAVSTKHWRIDPIANRVTRLTAEPLTLNAIAKGTIIDGVCKRVLAECDRVTGIVVNIGGDVRVAGDSTHIISIADPKSDAIGSAPIGKLAIRGQSVATSGSSERGFVIDGTSRSHLIDPRTGQPMQTTISATVIAKDAETADVLATICSVLPIAESIAMVNSLRDVECLLVTATGFMSQSLNWPGDVISNADDTSDAKAKHEMLVEISISKPDESRRYRRPYVAVWIEDKDGFPIRTLGLFLMADNPGPRWHRDLRHWYASDQMRRLVDDKLLIGTISKPTRNPGRYKFAWDGNDDSGNTVRPGSYTLYVEAAREHGTYQVMKYPFEFGDKPFEATLPGNIEIEAATVTFK